MAECSDPKPDAVPVKQDDTSKGYGWVVGILVFVLAWVAFAHSAHAWGIALGWLPSAAIATASGWIVYCCPWLLDLLAVLLELLAILG